MQTNHDTLRRVEVRCGDVIDGVAPFYDSTQTTPHGYRGGTTHTFLIPANDPITTSDLQDFELTAAPGEELSSFLGSLAYGDNTPDRYLGSLGATFRKA